MCASRDASSTLEPQPNAKFDGDGQCSRIGTWCRWRWQAGRHSTATSCNRQVDVTRRLVGAVVEVYYLSLRCKLLGRVGLWKVG